ncbi:hypothetical protein GQR58_008694 [Nymphon striatum]|nr:hypothetical protein GQR58_008694 [Nymphon striatum]
MAQLGRFTDELLPLASHNVAAAASHVDMRSPSHIEHHQPPAQYWCQLRKLPLLVGDIVTNHDDIGDFSSNPWMSCTVLVSAEKVAATCRRSSDHDEHWRLLLQLLDVVDLIMSQKVDEQRLSFMEMQVLIDNDSVVSLGEINKVIVNADEEMIHMPDHPEMTAVLHKDFPDYYPVELLKTSMATECMKIVIFSTPYKCGDTLLIIIDNDSVVSLGEINKVIVNADEEVCFIVHKFTVQRYDEHFHSWMIHMPGPSRNDSCTAQRLTGLLSSRCSHNAAELLKTSMATEGMKIVIFGTPYKCGDTLLIIIDSVVSLGEINKVIVNADEEVCFIVHKFTVQRYDEHFHSWMIHMPDHPEMTAVLHKDFPDYYPVGVHKCSHNAAELLKTSMATECMKIVIFGTPYKCGDTLLIIIDNDSVVSLGEINKVVVNANEEVCFIVHKFTVQRYDEHFHSWMIHMPDHPEMTAVLHKDLPDYYPVGVHKCSHNAAELLKTSMATECMKIVIFGTPYKCGDTLLIIIDNDSVVSLGEINKVIVNADEDVCFIVHKFTVQRYDEHFHSWMIHMPDHTEMTAVLHKDLPHYYPVGVHKCSHNAAELLKTSMATECMKIVIFGTPYKCGDTLLIIIDNDSVVSLGEINKVVVNADEEVCFIVHKFTVQRYDEHFHSWMIHMPDHPEMTAVLHKDLPDYYPVGVHKCSHNAAELLKTSMATECMKIVIFGTPYKCGDTLLIIIDNDSVVSLGEINKVIVNADEEYEEKHNFFKRAAVVVGNFINLAKTLAIRHQMHQLVHLNGGGLLRKDGCCATSGHPVNLSNFRCSNNAAELLKTSMATECMKIVIFGTPYKCGDTLLIIIDNDSVVSLGEINKVIVNADEEVCFIVHKFTVQRYDEHFHSWMIHMPDHTEMTAVLHKDLPHYYPVGVHKCSHNAAELLKTSMATECMKIVIFGTPYKCGDTLLIIIDNDSVVSLGEINKVVVNANEEVCFIVHKFTVQRYDEHFHSWMIHMPDHPEMTAVLHKDLPDYYPVGVHKCSHNAAELLKTSMATECMKIVIFGTPYKCGDTLLIIIDNDSVVSLGEINKVIVNADEDVCFIVHKFTVQRYDEHFHSWMIHMPDHTEMTAVLHKDLPHYYPVGVHKCSHNAAELLKTSMATECMKIVIFGTPYKCGDTLLIIIDNDSVVSLGEINKVVVNADEEVCFIVHKFTVQRYDEHFHSWMIHMPDHPEMTAVLHKDLPDYYPVGVHKCSHNAAELLKTSMATECMKIVIFGTPYKCGDTLLIIIDNDSVVSLGEINKVIVNADEEVCFIVHKFTVQRYDEHFHSWMIHMPDHPEMTAVLHKDFPDYYPVGVHKSYGCDSNICANFRYYIQGLK